MAVLLCIVCASAAALPGHRIVSLSPGLTELAYDAGAGRYLVGAAAVSYTHYPPQAAKLPSVGDAFHIDMERLIALKPDIVLVWASATPPDLLARLKQSDFKVAVFRPRKLEDIVKNLRRIGRLAGTSDQADKAAMHVEKTLRTLRRRHKNETPVTYFYEIGAHPLYTINGKQIISQGIALCGGKNVFADLEKLAAPVSLATVIARDPQAIIAGGNSAKLKRLFAPWHQWPKLTAVRNHALFGVPEDQISRATPRMLKGIKKICRDLDKVRQPD
jgi:iron complex transport system substrate-binding protein